MKESLRGHCNNSKPLRFQNGTTTLLCDRLLRKAGIKLRPPYYVPFLRNVVVRFFLSFFAFFLPLTSLLSISREGGSFKLIV
ncbi:DUF6404 family protein [Vibrio lentus]|nr:DUF6404 family protein [Vibrio lentus]